MMTCTVVPSAGNGIERNGVARHSQQRKDDVIARAAVVVDAEGIATGTELRAVGQAAERAADGACAVVVDDDELLADGHRSGEVGKDGERGACQGNGAG